MNSRRLVLWTVCIGVAIPAFFLILEHAFLRENPALSRLVLTTYRFDYVILALWPSSIILMADPKEQSMTILLFAISANIVLYGVIGWLVWLGLSRRRILLPIIGACLLAAGYYSLFRWYAGG